MDFVAATDERDEPGNEAVAVELRGGDGGEALETVIAE